MTGLEFTSEAAKQLEKVYLARDIVAQRVETIRHLNLSRGERVLDIGCGPGYLCESMGEIVGRYGAVVGIDISTDLIAFCNRQKSSTWLSYATGDATKIVHADASFDVVVCTQVAEYGLDVDRVLSEAFRVLKPGGRTVFVATDWDTVVWYSEYPDRVMKLWEEHCAHPHLARSMAYKSRPQMTARLASGTPQRPKRSRSCAAMRTPFIRRPSALTARASSRRRNCTISTPMPARASPGCRASSHSPSPSSQLSRAAAFERCKHHEEVGGAVALVLVIATGRTSRLHRDRQVRFGEQLL
jgi:ubiquinone/menaquinone biosynthesis C-methylase UbiE